MNKTDQAFELITKQLERRIADIQHGLMLLHSDPDIIYMDQMEFRDLKKDLEVAEKYLFRAKTVRLYLAGGVN